MNIHIPFTTIREDFNVYEAENGQILYAKSMVTDIFEGEDKKGKFGNLGFQSASHVITPQKIDTSKFEFLPSEQVLDEHITQDLKFKPVKEIINIYETEKLILLVDAKVEKISITNKKDKDENPILRYRSGIGVSVIPKNPEEKKPI